MGYSIKRRLYSKSNIIFLNECNELTYDFYVGSKADREFAWRSSSRINETKCNKYYLTAWNKCQLIHTINSF